MLTKSVFFKSRFPCHQEHNVQFQGMWKRNSTGHSPGTIFNRNSRGKDRVSFFIKRANIFYKIYIHLKTKIEILRNLPLATNHVCLNHQMPRATSVAKLVSQCLEDTIEHHFTFMSSTGWLVGCLFFLNDYYTSFSGSSFSFPFCWSICL